MIKSIKVQLKPNNKQNTLLFQSANTARFAYNWAIAKQEENFLNGGKFINDATLRKELTRLKKKELPWLYNYSNNIAKQAVKDACIAYMNYFKKNAKKPKFKTKRKTKPAFYHDNLKLIVTDRYIQLEKIGKVKIAEYGRIPLNAKYRNPRITFDGLHWFISVGIDIGNISIDTNTSDPIGIDVGVKRFAIVSNGTIYRNINKSQAVQKVNKRLKRLQRKASRRHKPLKQKGENTKKSMNLFKVERGIVKTYKRLTNIRMNYLHQITSELVKTKPAYIVVEDLNICGMLKNKHLSRVIAEQNISSFFHQLEYKSEWYNVKLIKANRFYPSSKLCSCCGRIKKDLKLSDRVYSCECGNIIDRDLQAAINLLNYPQLI